MRPEKAQGRHESRQIEMVHTPRLTMLSQKKSENITDEAQRNVLLATMSSQVYIYFFD